MQTRNRLLEINIHLALWLVIILFNFLLLKSNEIRFELMNQIFSMIIYMAIFYVQYIFIIPLLFKKRYLTFSLYSIILITVGLSTNLFIDKRKHDKRMEIVQEEIELQLDRDFDIDEESFFFPKPKRRNVRPFILSRIILYEVLAVLFFYLLSTIIRLLQKWQNDDKMKILLEKEKIDTELSYLKQQINPHFLFNSLNSIYSLSLSKSDDTTDSILKLSSILRYVLYESGKNTVPLIEELEVIKDYIELQKLRLTSMTSLIFEIVGKAADLRIEPLLLIPILENSFKYGVDNDEKSFIKILVEITANELVLKTKNRVVIKNGSSNSSGIGLNNIKRRLSLSYPDNHSLEYYEIDGEFQVKLSLKLKS